LCVTRVWQSVSPHRTNEKSIHGVSICGRPDNHVSTITMQEKDRFNEIKERLKLFLEHQVTHFRSV
jgi:hypothetical protein